MCVCECVGVCVLMYVCLDVSICVCMSVDVCVYSLSKKTRRKKGTTLTLSKNCVRSCNLDRISNRDELKVAYEKHNLT